VFYKILSLIMPLGEIDVQFAGSSDLGSSSHVNVTMVVYFSNNLASVGFEIKEFSPALKVNE
jgi:hypothetical protein